MLELKEILTEIIKFILKIVVCATLVGVTFKITDYIWKL